MAFGERFDSVDQLSPDRQSLRILHLAFEDHRRPGSGGGGRRNHLINSKLAERHEVTMVVARYPGARVRVEDGITYRPLGFSWGHFGSMIAYHLSIPWYVMRHRADVIVEEFAAPHSTDLVSLFTPCPTVAMVQYLFAREKSAEYRVPFWPLENVGVALHKSFISVSASVAERIKAINPDAVVEVVHAGVEPPAISPAGGEQTHLLFLGRLDFNVKGLDVLVDALQEVHKTWPGTRLCIAGTGPHEARMRDLIDKRGLSKDVTWLGWIEGLEKWTALANAAVVLMPSRYETFGLVALEAMSVGTPVVGSAIPSLEEINGDSEGMVLVAPCDGQAMGREVSRILGSSEARDRMSQAALKRAADFQWDIAVLATDRVYREAARTQGMRSVRSRLWMLLAALRSLRRIRRGPWPDAPA